MDTNQQDYQRIAKALHFLASHSSRQPSLQDAAAHVHMSEHHFQKLFSRWAGISPKRFLQYLTKEHIKGILAHNNIEEAAFSSGLSTKSRVYDLMVSCEAMTPGEYKQQGKDLKINYGFHQTPFGNCLIATTQRGICKIAFCEYDAMEAIEQELKTEWQLATIERNDRATQPISEKLFALQQSNKPFHLLVKGTNFQIKVWEALLNLKQGQLTTYDQIAKDIENPNAVRAVGSAIGKNPIAFLIPCHRVIRKTGEINQYRWGQVRKQAIIGWEQACLETKQKSAS